ncbi:MAG TPA: hypothetical protein VD838_01665 [Anaeromyxobacteraceae bacterium]|nr:hypothetical protein [Anaeromyxobacteraceae bacterium]
MYSILAATLLLAAAPATAADHGRIEDDYGRAVAEAKARNVPLVVDVWAPW